MSKVIETNVEWKEVPLNPMVDKACDHYFEFVEGECRCKKCRMGLLGVVDIVDGHPH
jgi:hypothetical protein